MSEDHGLVFLSYSTVDRDLAGNVKAGLEAYGFEVFLAHEDLVPTEDWQERIKAELSRCKVFMPLISEHFRASEWTDQEAGYAIARSPECLILSLLVPPMSSPHGFLKRAQGLRVNLRNVDQTCHQAVRAIEEKLGPSDERKSKAIERFSRSRSFAEAKRNLRGLSVFETFSREQMDRILLASLTNNQIYWPEELRKPLLTLFGRHGHLASPELRARFIERFKP